MNFSPDESNGPHSFDVIVVGAGPAGGQCARALARAGHRILLVEQHEDFRKNIFSSAGSPLGVLRQFDLPEDAVGSFWRKIEIVTTKVHGQWESEENLGVVFDFAKLREFLARDCRESGGEVWMGCRYLENRRENGEILVDLKTKSGETLTARCRVLVDATGFKRSVIYSSPEERPSFLKATGIEFQIEVPEENYRAFAETLVFFLGHRWSPKGYSWIFPMDNRQLKVGSAWINAPHKVVNDVKPLKRYVSQILKDYMGLEHYKTVDVHGSVLEYSSGLNDAYFRDAIVAIGDAVSTVNFLGGEGIRHGMEGAEIAARHIGDYLRGTAQSFQAYETEMKAYFSRTWNLSEQIGQRVYLEYDDARIDRGVGYLQSRTAREVVDLLFFYNFGNTAKGVFAYVIDKLASWMKRKIAFHFAKT